MNILDMGTEFLIPSYPFVYLQADNPCWEVAWELSENPETRSARGKLRSAPPPPQCDRKNCFMQGQGQETDGVWENNLGLDVAIGIF